MIDSVRRRSVTIALIVFVSACGPSREQDEAQKTLELIDSLRNSAPRDDATRLSVARSLAKLDVHDPAAVRARDACSKAYESLALGNQASALAMQKMSAQAVGEATQALGEAQSRIDESKKTMPECSEATGALRAMAPRR